MSKLVIETDASVKGGNPGTGSYGMVALSEWGTVIYEDCGLIPTRVTSNEAEYQALIEGLKFARDLGYVRHVECRSDSSIVINQMCGKYSCRVERLRLLSDQVADLAANFDQVDYIWIPRRYNGHADRLAAAAFTQYPKRIMKMIHRRDFEQLPPDYVMWYGVEDHTEGAEC